MTHEILKEQFWGGLPHCAADLASDSPAYRRALELESDILKTFGENIPQMFNDMIEAYLEYFDAAKEQAYIEGVRAGGRRMLEILGKSDDEKLLKIV